MVTSFRRRAVGILAAGCVGVSVLAACSNSTPNVANGGAPQRGDVTVTPGPNGVQDITVVADAQFRFVPATINAKVGRFHLTLRIKGGTPHNLTFSDPTSASVPTTSEGQTGTSDFSISTPGRYGFVCTIHESLNQKGTLVVSR